MGEEKREEELESELAPENQEENQEEEGEPPVEEDKPDFKKELESLEAKKPQRTELEKATYTARQILKRIEELGGDPNQILPKREDADQPEFVTKADLAENYARSLAKSDDELKVIMWQYRNGIQRTGNVHEDIDTAYWIANRSSIQRIYQELNRKETPPKEGGSGQKVPKKLIPEMPREQADVLKRRGYVFNPKTGRWEANHTAYRYDQTTNSWISEKK